MLRGKAASVELTLISALAPVTDQFINEYTVHHIVENIPCCKHVRATKGLKYVTD